MRRALVIGATGQDGSYMAELLLAKGYAVHCTYRRSSVDNTARIAYLPVELHKCDLADPLSVDRVLRTVHPHEIYNLADQDDVKWSYEVPSFNYDITFGAVGRLLESVRLVTPRSLVFQPSSATVFGPAPAPQNLTTPMSPMSPYACSKAGVRMLCSYYRAAYKLHITCGVMFNHDSERRGDGYLLQRLSRQAVAVAQGKQTKLRLFDKDAVVDIGYAPEYMECAHRALTAGVPECIVGTGRAYSVLSLALAALQEAGAPLDSIEDYKNDRLDRCTYVADTSSTDKFWKASTTAEQLVRRLVRAKCA